MQLTSHWQSTLGRRLRRCAVIVLPLISTSSLAASGNSIAAHPLIVGGAEKKDTELFQAIFKSELLRLGLELVDDASVSRFLASEPHHSCAGNNECLARLAVAVKAPVVFVLIHPYGSRVQLSGKLMLTTGTLARSFRNKESPRKPKQKVTAVMRQAFRAYLPALLPESLLGGPSVVAETDAPELAPIAPPKQAQRGPPVSKPPDELPEAKKTEPPRPKAEAIPLPAPPLVSTKPTPMEAPITIKEQPQTGLSQRQILGIGTASVGIALGIVGGIFEFQSAKSWSDFDAFYRGGLPARDQVSQLKTVSDRAKSQQTVGTIMLIGGGAMVAGGAYLYFFGNSREPGRSTISAAVHASPRSVSLRVKFP